MEKYKIYIKREGETTWTDVYSTYGIVCLRVPFKTMSDTKKPATNDWADEDGEDVYIPSRLFMEAYDLELELAYQGDELATNPFDLSLAHTQMDAFRDFLINADETDGIAPSLKLYSNRDGKGRGGLYLKSFGNEEACLMLKGQNGNVYNENVVTFNATFRVTDPVTVITSQD